MLRPGNAVVTIAAVLAAACSGTVTIEPGPGDPGGGDDDGPPAAGADAGTTPQPGAADAAEVPTGLSDLEFALFEEINLQREMRGLSRVSLRDDLNCAVRRHSDDVGSVGECSHTGTDGSTPGSRVTDCGGPGWTGEIIACGQGTPESAVQAWINSPGHNEIMFTPTQVHIGVAMHNNYWTAIFDN